jgi:hypothetical protein
MSDPNVLRIALDPNSLRDLGTIRKELGVDTGDAIGAALGTEALLLEHISNGDRVVIIDKEGRHHEVMVKDRVATSVGDG